MRTNHESHQLPTFPVYSATFLSSDSLVLGGGGGATRSGIKNKLRLYREVNGLLNIEDEIELGKDEDVPMSMAAHPSGKALVCGINSSMEQLQKKQNQNCRLYEIDDNRMKPVKAQGTLNTGDVEDYQRTTVFSPAGDLVAAAGSHHLSLLSYPSLSRLAKDIQVEKAEIYDATLSSSKLVIATTVNLLVYVLPKSDEKGKQKEASTELKLLNTVDRPTLKGGEAGSSFRSARFNPQNEKVLYTVLNTVPPRTRTKSSPRLAYVCKWDTTTWKETKLRKVGDKGITTFDVSPDGKLVAYGSSDLSIGILDANTLAPLLRILKAHEFPPTTIRFNPTSDLLVSGSADNTVRLVDVPDFDGGGWGMFILILVAIFVVLFAIATQIVLRSGHTFLT